MTFDPPSRKSISSGDDLTTVDWLLCIFCQLIGCIVGIVRLVQGRASGGKMIGLSILFSLMWSLIRYVLVSMNNR